MKIHRFQIPDIGLDFKAPKNVTFGWQESRKAFSLWFRDPDPEQNFVWYRVVATGDHVNNGILRATVVTDGMLETYHLVEIQK